MPIFRTAGIAALGLALSACAAVVDPYITPPNFGVAAGGDPYGAVAAAARGVSTEMRQKLQETEAFDFWSGAAVLVAGITATGLGAYGANRDAVVGAGLAAGAVLGGRAYVPLAVRKSIYTQGMGAIECSIAATNFDTGAGGSGAAPTPATTGAIANLASNAATGRASRQAKLAAVRPQLAAATGQLAAAGSLASLQAGQLAVAERRTAAALAAASGVGAARDDRAERLKSAVGGVVAAANDQLRANSLDLRAALAAANSGATDLIKQQKEAAKAAMDAAGKQEEKAEDTKEAAKTTEAAAAAHGDANTAAAARDLGEAAEESQDEAKTIKDQMGEILKRINVPQACFGSLLGS